MRFGRAMYLIRTLVAEHYFSAEKSRTKQTINLYFFVLCIYRVKNFVDLTVRGPRYKHVHSTTRLAQV